MNPRWLALRALGVALTFSAACGGKSTAPAQSRSVVRAGAAQPQTATGSPAGSAIVSARPHGAIMGQTGAPANKQQESMGQVAAPRPAPEASVRPPTDVEERLGPFALAPGPDLFVIVHSKRFEEQPGKLNEAVTWLEIRDAAGAIQDHQDYASTAERGEFTDQCSVGAKMLAGTNGKGILISSQCEPSTPLGGGSWRVFGLVAGKVAPFGKELSVEGDVERFVPGTITRQGAMTMISSDMLEFKVSTGNFSVIVPLRVNWMQGRLEPGMRCYEQSGRGMVESGCEVPLVDVQRVPGEQEMTFVRLFPEADEHMIPAHVVVRKDSKVEMLAAKVQTVLREHEGTTSLGVADDTWLKVSVDGKEGWIHSQEDFQAIGLPQAG